MRSGFRKMVSLFLVLSVLMSLCTVQAVAFDEVTAKDSRGVVYNPLYSYHVPLRVEEEEPEPGDVLMDSLAATYGTVEECAQQARDAMIQRKTTFYLYLHDPDGVVYFADDIFPLVTSEEYATTPTAGDYLSWSWSTYQEDWTYKYNGNWIVEITMEYYNTTSQENWFINRLSTVMKSLPLAGKTDYEKYEVIYEYICDLVDYDYDGLATHDDDYIDVYNNCVVDPYGNSDYLIFTAYACFARGKAVCQGYACLFYAMCHSAGLPARIVTSEDHAWNIAKIGDVWYNLDATWDGQDAVTTWDWFMLGSRSFDSTHVREEGYEGWDQSHPMSQYDHNACTGSHTYETSRIVVEPTCLSAGSSADICYYCGRSYNVKVVPTVGHHERTEIRQPTCTEDGGEYRVCQRCGFEYLEEFYERTGHDYVTSKKEATCEESGGILHTCTTCGHSYLENEIQPLGHVNREEVVVAATCTDNGVMHLVCLICGEEKDKTISFTGHDYEQTVTAPTCVASGATIRTCSTCDYSYVLSTTPATGHSYVSRVTEQTCTEDGFTTHTCSTCGYSYSDTYTTATGHTYNTVVTAATCTEQGYTTYTCTVCGDGYVGDYVASLGHSYQDTVTAPTCTQRGYTTHSCEICNISYQDTYISALGHNWDEGTVTVPSTADDEGIRIYVCYDCGATKTEVIPATGHSYDRGEIVTMPACTEPGVRIFTCLDCGKSYTAAIDATGHSYTDSVTKPTCTERGFTTHTCRSCGDSYVDFYVEPMGHSYDSGKVITEPGYLNSGVKEYSCTACEHGYTEEIAKLAVPFTDVTEGAFYHTPMLWALDKNITNGTSNVTFGPLGLCNRAQVVTFLWRAAGEPKPTSNNNPFEDVPSEGWYTDAVLWAVENGITNGLDATHFGPNATCNRAQVVTFLWRAAGEPEPENNSNPFEDVPSEGWYTDAVLWAVGEGITNGMSATTFGPNATCNRAQVVTFLYRTYN